MKRKVQMKFVTCPGSKIHVRYEPKFNGTRVELVEAGTTDIQAEIESYARYTDLHYMLHRLSVGDRSVLSAKTPIYGDFSGLPSNPVDAINLVHSAESAFGKMDASERACFNNDWRAWLASVLAGNVASINTGQSGVNNSEPVKEEKNES